jgi:hypothetical protein
MFLENLLCARCSSGQNSKQLNSFSSAYPYGFSSSGDVYQNHMRLVFKICSWYCDNPPQQSISKHGERSEEGILNITLPANFPSPFLIMTNFRHSKS